MANPSEEKKAAPKQEEKSWLDGLLEKIGFGDEPAQEASLSPSLRIDVRSNRAGLDDESMDELGIGSQQDAVKATAKQSAANGRGGASR